VQSITERFEQGASLLLINEETKKETVDLLQRLIQIESSNPPGNEDRIAAFIKAYLSQTGINVTQLPLEAGRSSLVARITGKERGSIVLCGHMDTVSAHEEKWTVPPFAGQIEQDRIWGRGSADMKSGVAVILELAKLITQNEFTPRKDLALVFTADEEQAYRGARSVVQSGLIDDAEFLIITEPTAGLAFPGQKGELWAEVTFSGKAAHGSVPELGISSILPASWFCLQLAEAARRFKPIPGRGQTTLNIGQINGGWQVNIVPDTTRVTLDFRVVSEPEKEQVLDLVQKLGTQAASQVGAQFSMRIMSDNPPIISKVDHPYVRDFLNAVNRPVGSSAGSTLASYYTDAGTIVPVLNIPVVIYGPGDISQAHQPDEYLTLDSLYEALDVLARFLDPENQQEVGLTVGQKSMDQTQIPLSPNEQ